MDRQRDRALRTARQIAARRTLHERGKAAPVEQENDLLLALERTGDRSVQRFAPGDRRRGLYTRRAAQIDDLHQRQWPGGGPHAIGQRERSDSTLRRLIERSEERRVGKSVDLGGRRSIEKNKETHERTEREH